MVSARSAPFLLASFGLYLGLSLDTVETASCSAGPITASALEDPLLVVHYDSVEQFEACLSNEILKANLSPLLDQPLPDDYLAVIKRKLDEIYPDGIPDDQLKLLGYLSRLYSPEEISKWKITSGDTLAALLSPDSGAWRPDQLQQLISTYVDLGGKLTGPLLSMLGGRNLCLLGADQLGQISPESVRQAEKLDVSSCSQDKKDILYEKARVAFASEEGTSAYYPLIQPYLGGAPVEDLRKLARSQVAMDISTFTNLKPEELKKLSAQDVKDLLMFHLPDLKEVENHPSVATWVKSHLQSELDSLGIGLQGGMMGPSLAGSTEVGSTPSVTVSPTLRSGASTVSAISVAATSDPNTTTFSNTSMFALVATDSFTTPPFKVTPAADKTSASTETSTTTTIGLKPEDAVSTNTIATSNVTATSEDTTKVPLDPTTAVGTSMTTTSDTMTSYTITTNGSVLEVGRGVDTTTSVDTVTVSANVTTDGTTLPTMATPINVTVSDNTTVVSTNVTTNGTIQPTVASHINTTMSVNSTVVSTNVTTSGTIQPTVASHINTTTSVNTMAASINITTDGTVQPTIASHINTTSFVNTSAASANVTTTWTILPTVATNVNVTSTPNATIFHTPTLNISHTPTTPNATVTTSSERPPAPPVPPPNATVPVFLSTPPLMSGKTPDVSSRTTVRSSETPPKTAVSPSPGRLHTTVAVTPERRTTSRTPPKTKQPSHPTPNGYINIRPLSASASSPSLSCLLLMPSLAVGLSVLRGLF